MMNVNALKLDFQFDANRMKEELELISDSFQAIENSSTKKSLFGMHLILPSKDGLSNEKGETFCMTEELKRSAYLQKVLNTFQCDKLTFRVQNLKAGGKIEKHSDLDKGLNNNIVRLNIPVSTNDEIYTYYNDERILMKNGECWLPNVSKLHEMENRSDETRWLILVDCDLNDWWKEILNQSGIDIKSDTKYGTYSIEDLLSMKESFISMNANAIVIKELEIEIDSRK